MLFSHLKKKSHAESQTTYLKEYENFVVGNDLFALTFFKDLIKLEPSSNLCLEESLELENLIPNGPSVLRGNENIEIVKNYFPDMISADFEFKSDVKFYKDSDFHSFGGRKKPEKVLDGEEFFTQKKLDLDVKDLLLTQELKDFFEKQKNDFITLKIQTIVRQADFWEVVFVNGNKIKCHKLIWGKQPFLLLSLLSNKQDFLQPFIDFCQSTKRPFGFIVNFSVKSDMAITESTDTIFIPKSLTYDLGHFIGEFKPFNAFTQTQEFSFFSFLAEEDSDVEAVGRQIHQLKRSLFKIFPKLVNKKLEESIIVSDQKSSYFHGSDQFFQKSELKDFKNIRFIGCDAPLLPKFLQHKKIDLDSNKISFLGRSVLANQQFFDVTE
ncbi:MAG: hypothetical protein U0T83_02150 [Bacteriovoracaceae bacterium]